MSYTERDAWADEKALGDWPFDRWGIGSPTLRTDFDYLKFFPRPQVSTIAYRLRTAFGKHSEIDLVGALVAASNTVNAAIEISEQDAYAVWSKQEVWLPVLDESINGTENPAEMLVDSLHVADLYGAFSAQQQCAAIGLWLIGLWDIYKTNGDYQDQHWAITQVAVVLAQAEWYAGYAECDKKHKTKLAIRNTVAADVRHAANKERKINAKNWYLENVFSNKADAARRISDRFSITNDVAKRWVSEFSRAS